MFEEERMSMMGFWGDVDLGLLGNNRSCNGGVNYCGVGMGNDFIKVGEFLGLGNDFTKVAGLDQECGLPLLFIF